MSDSRKDLVKFIAYYQSCTIPHGNHTGFKKEVYKHLSELQKKVKFLAFYKHIKEDSKWLYSIIAVKFSDDTIEYFLFKKIQDGDSGGDWIMQWYTPESLIHSIRKMNTHWTFPPKSKLYE